MDHSTRRQFLANTVAALSAAVVLPMTINHASASESAAVTHNVEIRTLKFVPDRLSVKAGDTIVWTNYDIAPHTATANDKSWDTGKLRKGESKSIVVSEAMDLNYFCLFHPHMTASLELAS